MRPGTDAVRNPRIIQQWSEYSVCFMVIIATWQRQIRPPVISCDQYGPLAYWVSSAWQSIRGEQSLSFLPPVLTLETSCIKVRWRSRRSFEIHMTPSRIGFRRIRCRYELEIRYSNFGNPMSRERQLVANAKLASALARFICLRLGRQEQRGVETNIPARGWI